MCYVNMADGGVIQEQLRYMLETLMHSRHQEHTRTVPALVRNVCWCMFQRLEPLHPPPPNHLLTFGFAGNDEWSSFEVSESAKNTDKTLQTALWMQKIIILGRSLKPGVCPRPSRGERNNPQY